MIWPQNAFALYSNSASDSYLKGSLGIGTSAPNSAVKLHVAGKGLFEDQVEIYNNKSLLIGNLSLSENSLFLGADDSDIEADGYLTFSPNNTEIMRLTMAGSVGIGATSPLGKLHVKTSEVSGASVSSVADDFVLEVNGDGGLTIITPNTSTGTLGFGNDNDSLDAWVSYVTGSYMELGIVGDYAMRLYDDELSFGQENTVSTTAGDLYLSPFDDLLITSSVGIGTTAPDEELDVIGDVALSNYLYFANGTTEYLRWDASDFILTDDLLPGTNDALNLGSNSYRWADLYLGPGTIHIGTSTSDEYTLSYDTTNNRLGFNVNGSGNPEIVFNANGYLGIGTTSPSTALQVAGTITATDITCSNCLGQGDIGNSSIGTGELRTATTSTAGSTFANVTMNDYTFFPNFEVDDCGSPYTPGFKVFQTNATNDTVGRIWVDASCTGGSWDVRWRYITSSDRPTIWTITNTDGSIVNAWESEDPIDPSKYPENPDPFIGNTLEEGQRSISVEPLTITQLNNIYSQLPTGDRNNILNKLRIYVANERQWLTTLSSINDLNNIEERYRPSSRQWAMRFLADYYEISPAEFIMEFTTIQNDKLTVIAGFYDALDTHLTRRTVTFAQNEAKLAKLLLLPVEQQGADLAELYSVQENEGNLEPGDLVTMGSPESPGVIVKSKISYDSKIMGIISTDPKLLLGRNTSESDVKVACQACAN